MEPKRTNTKYPTRSELTVDFLRLKYLVTTDINSVNSNRFPSRLMNTWLALTEKYLSNILPKKKPYCIVAVEESILIAYLIIQPVNDRGSCWSLSLPKFINKSKSTNDRNIKLKLIRGAIKLTSNINNNCLIKYPSDYFEDLTVARELGFQPLKYIKTWSINSSNREKIITRINPNSINYFKWEVVDRSNAILACKLQKVRDSIQLRETMDIQPIDLIKGSNRLTRILATNSNNNLKAIAGISKQKFADDKDTFLIYRDVIWDERIINYLPELLKILCSEEREILIETTDKDDHINLFLKEVGLKSEKNKTLLAKSNLIRKSISKSSSNKISLAPILDEFEPRQPPLPSP